VAKKAAVSGSEFFGYQPYSASLSKSGIKKTSSNKGLQAEIVICAPNVTSSDINTLLAKAPKWQIDRIKDKSNDIVMVAGQAGPLWVVWPKNSSASYANYRALVGQAAIEALRMGITSCRLMNKNSDDQQQLGAVVGFFMANYSFRGFWPTPAQGMAIAPLAWEEFSQSVVGEGMVIADSVNLARHLVNLPAAALYPESFATLIKSLEQHAPKTISVEVWDEKKLAKESIGLILGVGQAAVNKPRLVRLRYRPKGGSPKMAPVALVGKGITFDTGGLDLKPSSGMRLMKKDMGGAAALAGFSYYLASVKPNRPIDIYFAMAENSVSAESFRPGDVLISRSKKTVEIHNTDAEGRLVLADALTLAQEATGSEKPEHIIDVATLTGAIKVGLGSEVAGLFSNDDRLREHLYQSGKRCGEPVWPMPLYQDYLPQLRSDVADISNAASSRFGGAITAALFLEQFVSAASWAHLDIYAWQEQPTGAFQETGGSGQAVQLLITALTDVGRNDASG